MPSRCLALPVLAALLVAPAPAAADEAYVCDGGALVFVPPGSLEAMKRSHPCIARYYGLSLEPAVSGPPSPADPREAGPGGTATAANLKPPIAPAGEPRAATRLAAAAKTPAPPMAAAGTDFRNVKVLNGTEGGSGHYFHGR